MMDRSGQHATALRRAAWKWLSCFGCLLCALVLAIPSRAIPASPHRLAHPPALLSPEVMRAARPLSVQNDHTVPTVHAELQQASTDEQWQRSFHPVSLGQAELDEVLFAGKTVRTRVPRHWEVREIAYGREVRLVLSPAGAVFHQNMPRDGMWFCVHPLIEPPSADAESLRVFLTERLKLAEPDAQPLEQPQPMQLGGWWGFQQAYAAPPLPVPADAQVPVRGFHFVAATTWGICELHTVCGESQLVERQSDWQLLIENTALEQPAIAAPLAADQVRDAEMIFGSWKSFRSRMRLFADGRLEISLDPRPSETVEQAGPGTLLQGHYEARDNVLLVTWADGSRTNYRWRLDQDQLLLTDHDGQISELRRLLE